MPTELSQNRPIPIALVATELRVGGAERSLVNLATRLDTRRYRPTVVALSGEPSGERALLVRQLRQAGIEVAFLGLSRVWQLPQGIARLRQQFRRSRCEGVISFLYHANVLTRLALGRTKVCHVMGIRVADPRSWRTRIERQAARNAAAVVCVSRRVAEACQQKGYPADRLHVIPNGIDLVEFDRQSTGVQFPWPAGRTAIGIMGRLDRQKGSHLIPELAEQLWRRHPKTVVVIAGEGPLGPQLKVWADAQPPERICWLGWSNQPHALLRAIDAVALPSLWEGMPNTVIEAMSAKKPVVAFDVEGLDELLHDEGDDRSLAWQRVPPGDVERLATKLSQLIENKGLAARLGEANRNRIAHHFTLAESTARYEALLTQLLVPREGG